MQLASAAKEDIVDSLVPELLLILDELTKADGDMLHWAGKFDYMEGVVSVSKAPTRRKFAKTTPDDEK